MAVETVDLGLVVGPAGRDGASLFGTCDDQGINKTVTLDVDAETLSSDIIKPGIVINVKFNSQTIDYHDITLQFYDKTKTVSTKRYNLVCYYRYQGLLGSSGSYTLSSVNMTYSASFGFTSSVFPWVSSEILPLYVLDDTHICLMYEDLASGGMPIGTCDSASSTLEKNITLDKPIQLLSGTLIKVYFWYGILSSTAVDDTEQRVIVTLKCKTINGALTNYRICDRNGYNLSYSAGSGWSDNSYCTFRLDADSLDGFHWTLVGVDTATPVLSRGVNTVCGLNNTLNIQGNSTYELRTTTAFGASNIYRMDDIVFGAQNKDLIGDQLSALPSKAMYNMIIGSVNTVDDSSSNLVLGYSATINGALIDNTYCQGENICITPGGAKIVGAQSIVIGQGYSDPAGIAIGSAQSGYAIGSADNTYANMGGVAIGTRATGPGAASGVNKKGARAAGVNSIAIGSAYGAEKSAAYAAGTESISIGSSSSSQGDFGVVFGALSSTALSGAVVIGSKSTALYEGGIVLGYEANVNNRYGISIGVRALSSGSAHGSIAIGSGASSSLVGTDTTGARASGVSAIAIGSGSTSSVPAYAHSDYAIAIGAGTNVGHAYGVAIGLNATPKGSNAITIGTNTQAYNHGVAISERAAAQQDSISIGYDAGLFYTQSSGEFGWVSIGRETAPSDKAVVIGFKAQTGNHKTVAVGESANAAGAYAIAIGSGSSASVEKSVAIGYAAGIGSSANSSVALGYNSGALEANTVSVGSSIHELYRRIVNVDEPTDIHDAATKQYVDNAVANAGGGTSIRAMTVDEISAIFA